MQVNHDDGNHMSRVSIGWTVKKVKRVISQVWGILENSDGVALDDDDVITAAGAPYVFKPQPQPQMPQGQPQQGQQQQPPQPPPPQQQNGKIWSS